MQIFGHDVGREFGINKYATLAVKTGKISKFNGILLPDRRVMKGLIDGAGYKYLGMLEADQIRYAKMKEKGASWIPQESWQGFID